jgi:xylulokinase
MPVPTGKILGTVPARVAAELGLKSPVVCVVGAHDQCCNALGAGVIQSGRAVCGIGTVECVAPVYGSIPDKARMLDFGLNIEHHAIPGHYTSFIYNQAGSLVKWYRSTFARADLANAPAGTNVFALLDGEMPAEPTRLLALPHFEPTGAPGFIQHSAGSIAGLTMDTTRGDILKAILECETFYFLDSLDTLKELGIDTAYFIATGGGSNSDPWLQIKSDIFGVPYERCVTPEAGVMGAAMIAAVAVGACASYAEAVDLFVKPGKVFEPDMRRHSFYREKYGQYRQLYPSLKKILAWTAAQPEGE